MNYDFARSYGSHPGSPSVTKINIKFISVEARVYPLKRPMKSLAQQSSFIIPGLFQIAAQIEKPIVPPARKPATLITQKEFAALRMEAMKSSTPRSMKSSSGSVASSWSFVVRK